MNDLTFTLKHLRKYDPPDPYWTPLLEGLEHPPLNTRISLGDVAAINGSRGAWYTVRALDWANKDVRRALCAILSKAVERAETTNRLVGARNNGPAIELGLLEKEPSSVVASQRAMRMTATIWSIEIEGRRRLARETPALAGKVVVDTIELPVQRTDIVTMVAPLIVGVVRR